MTPCMVSEFPLLESPPAISKTTCGRNGKSKFSVQLVAKFCGTVQKFGPYGTQLEVGMAQFLWNEWSAFCNITMATVLLPLVSVHGISFSVVLLVLKVGPTVPTLPRFYEIIPPGDTLPETTLPSKNTPWGNPAPPWLGVLTLTDPRRGVLTLTLTLALTDPRGGKLSENWH